MRIIPNQFEKRFVTCLMKNGKKSIRGNYPNESEPIRNQVFNPNLSKVWIIRINSD